MLKKQGWDGVEVPILDFQIDYDAWGRRLRDLGLRCTASTARGPAENLISGDSRIRAVGVSATKRTLDCCRALGVEILSGPFHSAIGEFSGQPATQQEWQWAVEGMRQVAEHADRCGVTLGLEYLNRFECYLLNQTDDMIRFLNDVHHPRCRMIYDTFHANIEEKNPILALKNSAPYLALVHISENDRSTPGVGTFVGEKPSAN